MLIKETAKAFINNRAYFWQLKLWNLQGLAATNIFDYMYVARKRWFKIGELFSGNSAYGIGYILRRYCKYRGTIFFATEHSCAIIGDERNNSDLNNHNRKIVCVTSRHRQKMAQVHTQKLLIPIGPSIIHYAQPLYDEIALGNIKKNLGKTLLVFVNHSNGDSAIYGGEEALAKKVEDIAKEHDFDTIMICLFYIDIKRGKGIFYEKRGWTVVTAGDRGNIDFADCLKTILAIADHVVISGFGSPLGYAAYLNKPITFINTESHYSGTNAEVLLDYLANRNRWAAELFGEYEEELDPRKREILSEYFGYEETLSPKQMLCLIQFAKKIEHISKMKVETLRRISNKKRFDSIRGILNDAIDVFAKYYE